MKLIVFGASGTCGSHLVRLACAAYEVTAVVRESTAWDAPDGVAVVRGDVLDPRFVRSAVASHELVASCLGMRYAHPWARRQSPDDLVSRATANITRAMKAEGIRRLVLVSAAGVGDSRPAMNWPMRVMLATSNVGAAYADLDRADRALQECGLDWQSVRPTTLTNGPCADRVAVVDRYRATDRIARASVAAFMLRSLSSTEPVARTPMITTARGHVGAAETAPSPTSLS